MKFKLKKTQLKTLTSTSNTLGHEATPHVAGGSSYATYRCPPPPVDSNACSMDCFSAPEPGQACVITG
ncbi:hypothetical protein [Pseudoalteromonas phenolica]|uniref:hypothetical protein n=1 Tax=Pseudoalteromonas phenolica TaxID=161398 RepID=UPI0038502731